MTARIVLGAAAVLVLGSCVYLFFEVRAKPASAEASGSKQPEVAKADTGADRGEKSDESDVPAKDKPTISTIHEGAKAPRRIMPTVTATGKINSDPEPPPEPAADPADGKTAVKLEAVMLEANKAYDRLDLDEARSIAQKVLKQQPGNSRMLRIMVSSACIENDGPEAQKHYNLLPVPDREQMKTRCSKYGVTFTDPPK